jgi:hypothetical protein
LNLLHGAGEGGNYTHRPSKSGKTLERDDNRRKNADEKAGE